MGNDDSTGLAVYKLSGIMCFPSVVTVFLASGYWTMALVLTLLAFSLYIGSRSMKCINCVYVLVFSVGYLLATASVWLYKENHDSIAILGLVSIYVGWQYIFGWLITNDYIQLR